jgi:hypothetical protein
VGYIISVVTVAAGNSPFDNSDETTTSLFRHNYFKPLASDMQLPDQLAVRNIQLRGENTQP